MRSSMLRQQQPQHIPVRTTDDDDDDDDELIAAAATGATAIDVGDENDFADGSNHLHHREAAHRGGTDDDIDDDEADGILLHRNHHNHNGGRPTTSTGTSTTTTTSTSSISNVPSLVVAFSAAATTGGTSYAFGLYAAALKRQLQLSQSELDSIATTFFVAGLFSWLPGWLSDACGTRFALTLGGVTGASTLLLYWLVARQLLPMAIPHGYLVCVLSSLGVGTFLSCAMVTGAVFKIIVATAGPGLKGSAVGAAKGYVGLGAGLYACVFEALRGPFPHRTSDRDFLPMAAALFLMCATLPGLLLLPTQATLQRCTVRHDATARHVRVLYLSLAALAVLIVLNSMLNLYESSEGYAQHHASQAGSGSTNVVTSLTNAVNENNDENDGDDDDDDDETNSGSSSDLVAAAEHEILLSEGGGGSLGSSPAPGQQSNVYLGGLLLSIWLVPIASLLVLPREKRPAPSWHDDGVMLLPDNRDDDVDENNNNENNNDSADSRGGNHIHNQRRRSIRSGGASSDEEDPLASINNDDEDSRVVAVADGDDEEEERGLLVVRDGEQRSGRRSIRNRVSPSRSGSISASSPPRGSDSERSSSSSGSEQQQPQQPPADAETETNLNLFEMLQTRSALLMLWTTTVLVGAGTVMTNNLGQMVESLGFPAAVTSASLALFSVAQAAGRVLTGSLSEAALNWNTHRFGIDNGVPRPFWLLVASLVGCLAHLILGLAESRVVFVLGATLSGLAFGCVWPLMVLITGEIFGTANVGANYMFFDGTTSAAGTLLLTKVIAQDVYERHIGPNAPDEYTCLGTGCFQNTHLAVAALSLTCVVTSFGVLYTSRHVYNKVSLHLA